MKATKILLYEHDVILQGLAVLDVIAGRLAAGEAVPAQAVAELLEFFSAFADGCHHAKEEGILFPALEAAGVPREGGPVGVLLGEHGEGRSLVSALKRDAAAINGDAAARRRFIAAAREYVSLLEQHIAKENEVLFPGADRMLSEEQDREIIAAFERHEELEMGPGVHERFHHLLDDLAARYPDAAGRRRH